MDSGLQNNVFSEISILKHLLSQNPSNSTLHGYQKSGSKQKVVECEASADLHPSTLQLSGDCQNVQQKQIVVSDTHAIPDHEHTLQLQNKPVCLPGEIMEVENQFNEDHSFSSTLTKKSDPANTSFLQSRRPIFQESPSKISLQQSFSGHCKALPKFQDAFSKTSDCNSYVPFKKRLIESWSVQPNREPYQGDPAPVQRYKEHQKIVLSIPCNSSLKIYSMINKGHSYSKKSLPSSQVIGNEICKNTYSQNSLIAQLQGPSVVISPESVRLSVASLSKTSGHAYRTAEFIGKCSTSNTEDKSDERSSLGSIGHSTTDNVKMFNGRYLEETDVCVQKVLVPVVDLGMSPSLSSLQNVSTHCQTGNIEQRKVSRRPSTPLKARFSVDNKPYTNILSESSGIQGSQSQLQGSSSSFPVIDVETNQPLADDEIMFGYPTNIVSVIPKYSNTLVLQNPSDTNLVPLDLRVCKQASSTVLDDSANEDKKRIGVENITEKEPSQCYEYGTELKEPEKDSKVMIENGAEKYSVLCYKNIGEKKFRPYDKNGIEKNFKLYENYSENRSSAFSETNNEHEEQGPSVGNDTEKEPCQCDEYGTEMNEPEKESKVIIENGADKYSGVCYENVGEKELRACDENGSEKNSKLCYENYSEDRSAFSETNNEHEEQGPSVGNDTEKEPCQCDEYGTEIIEPEKDSKLFIENGAEKYSGVCYENVGEKELRAYDENGSEKNSKLCYENDSENRSTACSETNNEQESSKCDINDSEKDIKAFDETDLWEAFEMDEEGLRELGNDIKGLEDIMEYLAGSEETCNQSGSAEIASSARRRKPKIRGSPQIRGSTRRQGQSYNLRSKVDLSRMIITRGQKRSGKSELSDVFSGVGFIDRCSARASNSRMGNNSLRSNQSSWKANICKIEPKVEISSQPHTKNITDCPAAVPANSSNNLLIRLKVDSGTGEINTKQKIPEYCPECLEVLCPSRFTISVDNFSLKTVCIGCGSTISIIFELVSGSCAETGGIHSKRKSKRKKGW